MHDSRRFPVNLRQAAVILDIFPKYFTVYKFSRCFFLNNFPAFQGPLILETATIPF